MLSKGTYPRGIKHMVMKRLVQESIGHIGFQTNYPSTDLFVFLGTESFPYFYQIFFLSPKILLLGFPVNTAFVIAIHLLLPVRGENNPIVH